MEWFRIARPRGRPRNSRWGRNSLPALPGERSLAVQIAAIAFGSVLSVCAATSLFAPVVPERSARRIEAAVQIVPAQGRDGDADLARALAIAKDTAGILAARPVPKADAEAMLKPWLGPTLDMSSLPVPRLVLLTIDPETRPDLSDLARRLREVPGAMLDERVAETAPVVERAASNPGPPPGVSASALCAAAAGVFAAVRSRLAANRAELELLGLLGGAPGLIARAYMWRHLAVGALSSGLGALAALGGWIVLVGEGGPDAAPVATPFLFCTAPGVALLLGAVSGTACFLSVKAFLR